MKSTAYAGEKNPNYGNKGSLNPIWKSDVKITNSGYRKIRCLNHPFADCDDFVMEHRLIAEKFLLDENNAVEVNGVKYLNPQYDVHHVNGDRLDNCVENLLVLTKGDHRRLHASLCRRRKTS